jgi:ABC-type glutathione transport system ATPase component
MNTQPKMKQTIISVIGPSGCGKSQYINPIVKQLRNNGYTVDIENLTEKHVPRFLKTLNSKAQFVILHIGTSAELNMRIEFHNWGGPMELIGALHGEEKTA